MALSKKLAFQLVDSKFLNKFSMFFWVVYHMGNLHFVSWSAGEWRLSKILPSYRSPTAIKINELFLLDSKNKAIVLSNLQVGFLAEWSKRMPCPGKIPRNYFKNQRGIDKCRSRFVSEVKKGRMLGGVGWTKNTVE